jgi:LytS/YehU family sensor histidine kinase
MRYMIYETNDSIVPISKELVYLESYIDLQKIRFGDDIHIDFKHELGPKSSHIEPMLLIPFVENAFKHGVGFIENPTIEIELKDSATELYFKVANKKGTTINEMKDESSGIGLANVKRRLELLYPTNHRLDVNDFGSEFIITLTIQHV